MSGNYYGHDTTGWQKQQIKSEFICREIDREMDIHIFLQGKIAQVTKFKLY